MSKLFGEFKRTRIKHSEFDLSDYEFLNVSAWDSATYARNLLEDWFEKFPNKTTHFLNRFTNTKDDLQHQGAFYELYIFQLLKMQGFSVDVTDIGSENLPDFGIAKETNQLFIECTLGIDPNRSKTDKIKDSILNAVEKTHSPNCCVSVSFEESNHISPSLKAIKRTLQALINNEAMNVSHFDDGNWNISFKKIRVKADRTVGGISGGRAGFLDGESMKFLQKAIMSKRASRYESLEVPYIIAINSLDMSLSFDIISAVLYGNKKFSYIRPFFQREKNRRVSGVLIARNCRWSSMGVAEITLWHNPFSSYAVEKNLFKVGQVIPKINEKNIVLFEIIKGKRACDILQIREHYL